MLNSDIPVIWLMQTHSLSYRSYPKSRDATAFTYFQRNGNYFIKFVETNNTDPQKISMFEYGKEETPFNVRIYMKNGKVTRDFGETNWFFN